MLKPDFHFFSGGKFTPATSYIHIVYCINFPYRLIFWLAYWAHIPPNWLTILNLALALMGAGAIAQEHWLAALLFVYAADLCDASDGALARYTARTSRLGRFLDTLVDIISIIAIHIAFVIALLPHTGYLVAILLPFISGAIMIGQGSWQHYFGLQYALRVKTHVNTRMDERESDGTAAPLEKFLHILYVVALAWQDRLVRRCDNLLTQHHSTEAREKSFTHKTLLFWNSFFLFRFPLYILVCAALLTNAQTALTVYIAFFSLAFALFLIYRVHIITAYEKPQHLS